MRYRSLAAVPFSRFLSALAPGIIIAALLVLRPQPVGAQELDLQITELVCAGHPEVVVIANMGDQPVEMAGLRLQSDPPDEESLALGAVGILNPGQSALVESGPSTEAAFVWSRDFVFRDNDATDYAQIVNDAGDVLVRMRCPAAQGATATPAPAPTVEPTPSPAATPVADAVPTFGGAPLVAAGAVSPIAMMAAGSWLLSAGLGAFALRFQDSHFPPGGPAAAGQATARARRRPPAYLLAAAILLLPLAVLLIMLQRGEKDRD